MNHNRFDISCFRYMGANKRRIVAEWLLYVQPDNQHQEIFLKRVQFALEQIHYDYMIATIEPSIDENEDVFYKRGCKSENDMSFIKWQNTAARFYTDDEWRSELASLQEGDLLKAYKMATQYWSLNAVVEKVQRENQTTELYQLYDGFVTVKNQHEGQGRQFEPTFDYVSRELADVGSKVYGIVVLKRN